MTFATIQKQQVIVKNAKQFSLWKEIEQIMVMAQNEAIAVGVTMTSEYIGFPYYKGTPVFMINHDMARINQMISSLVHNAISSSKKEGTIMIKCQLIQSNMNTQAFSHSDLEEIQGLEISGDGVAKRVESQTEAARIMNK